MELIACYCNWGVPGVHALPAHHHPYSPDDAWVDSPRSPDSGPFKDVPYKMRIPSPEQEPRFWVDWKAVLRALAKPVQVFGVVRYDPGMSSPEVAISVKQVTPSLQMALREVGRLNQMAPPGVIYTWQPTRMAT